MSLPYPPKVPYMRAEHPMVKVMKEARGWQAMIRANVMARRRGRPVR